MIGGAARGGGTGAGAAFGNGIRVGGAEGRLHPFVELELRYDSNVATYYQPASRPGGDLILHVRPGLPLNVPGDTVAVDLRAVLDWAQYFGIQDSSRIETTKDLSNLYANVSLGVGFNRKGQVGFEIDEKFARSNQPTVYSIATGDHLQLQRPHAERAVAPGRRGPDRGPGRRLVHRVLRGLQVGRGLRPLQRQPVLQLALPLRARLQQLGANLGANWKFLPKTAALLDLSWFDRVPNSTLYSIAGTGMRAQAGVTGLVTTHLAATVKAGYGTTLSLSLDPAAVPQATVSRFGTWLALVSAEWIPSQPLEPQADLEPRPRLRPRHHLGALHRHPRDAGREEQAQQPAHRRRPGGLGHARPTATRPARTSNVLTARPSLQAELTRWLMLELAYQYTDRTTDAATAPPGWKYSKHEVWLRGVVTY